MENNPVAVDSSTNRCERVSYLDNETYREQGRDPKTETAQNKKNYNPDSHKNKTFKKNNQKNPTQEQGKTLRNRDSNTQGSVGKWGAGATHQGQSEQKETEHNTSSAKTLELNKRK